MEAILNFLFKPGQLLHAAYIVVTGKPGEKSHFAVNHVNMWVVSTMFWAFMLFASCWLAVVALMP